MDCCDVNVGDSDVRLCYNGEDRARSAIRMMLGLIVNNDSRRWIWGDRRHLWCWTYKVYYDIFCTIECYSFIHTPIESRTSWRLNRVNIGRLSFCGVLSDEKPLSKQRAPLYKVNKQHLSL